MGEREKVGDDVEGEKEASLLSLSLFWREIEKSSDGLPDDSSTLYVRSSGICATFAYSTDAQLCRKREFFSLLPDNIFPTFALFCVLGTKLSCCCLMPLSPPPNRLPMPGSSIFTSPFVRECKSNIDIIIISFFAFSFSSIQKATTRRSKKGRKNKVEKPL